MRWRVAKRLLDGWNRQPASVVLPMPWVARRQVGRWYGDRSRRRPTSARERQWARPSVVIGTCSCGLTQNFAKTGWRCRRCGEDYIPF